MQDNQLDYLGLAELAAAPLSTGRSVNADGESITSFGGSSTYEGSGQLALTLDQQRSLKDAQDGLMSLQAMGDAVLLGASRVNNNANTNGNGGSSLSPKNQLLGFGEQTLTRGIECAINVQCRVLYI